MPEERKFVSILFADLVGSTALGAENDPEVVRAVMARYFGEMQRIAEVFGGTVDKFIGDAIMVVFGVPRLHDDDAERAVRAGLVMRDATTQLEAELGIRLAVRVGVNTGEAVVGVGSDGRLLLVGDSVNMAARLQEAADVGEVVVGPVTEQLTRAAIVFETLEPMKAKGKRDPVRAFRALSPMQAIPSRTHGRPLRRTPFVGRQRELALLVETCARVAQDRRPHLFTVVGSAGVGKSRLAREAFDRIQSRITARVLEGRCLPYGDAITYWPLLEALQEDLGIDRGDAREMAAAKLIQGVRDRVADESEARAVSTRLAVLLGLEPPGSIGPAEGLRTELGWALRRYLAHAPTPLVLTIDDLQWAEGDLIALIQYLVERVTDVPLLVVCLARPELLETQPAWSAGLRNATLLTLDPLTPAETSTLITGLLESDSLPASLKEGIVDRSEGNPLFCEEFLQMLIDDLRLVRMNNRWQVRGAVDVSIPVTIQALLAARLDGLPGPEKHVLQAASIVGERFSRGEVAVLTEGPVDAALEEAMRKDLVVEEPRPTRPDQLRFKHMLMRDVAYASLRKDDRATLHERYFRYLDRAAGDRRQEVSEILAYHAHSAYLLSRELRLSPQVLKARARLAFESALEAGELAVGREDPTALGIAIEHASGAAKDLDEREDGMATARLGLLRAEQFRRAGDLRAALESLAGSAAAARQADRADLAAQAHLAMARLHRGFLDGPAVAREATEAARLYREAKNPGGELEAEWTAAFPLFLTGQIGVFMERGARLQQRAVGLGEHARAAGILAFLAQVAVLSGKPDEARAWTAEAAELAAQHGLRTPARRSDHAAAILARMLGDFGAAEAGLRRLLATADEAGEEWDVLTFQTELAEVLIDEGKLEEAEALMQRAQQSSERMGERWQRVFILNNRARAALRRGEQAMADTCIRQAVAAAHPDDFAAQAAIHRTLGSVLAAVGAAEEADATFRRGLRLGAASEPSFAMVDLSLAYAEFLVGCQRNAEAGPLLDAAQQWLERCGYGVRKREIAQLRERLDEAVGAQS